MWGGDLGCVSEVYDSCRKETLGAPFSCLPSGSMAPPTGLDYCNKNGVCVCDLVSHKGAQGAGLDGAQSGNIPSGGQCSHLRRSFFHTAGLHHSEGGSSAVCGTPPCCFQRTGVPILKQSFPISRWLFWARLQWGVRATTANTRGFPLVLRRQARSGVVCQLLCVALDLEKVPLSNTENRPGLPPTPGRTVSLLKTHPSVSEERLLCFW